MIEVWRRTLLGGSAERVDEGGHVAASVAASLKGALLVGLAVWNVTMAVVILAADPRIPAVELCAFHLLLALIALASRRGLIRFEVCLVLGYCLWATDYLAARSVDDAITLSACWLGNLLYAVPAVALRTRARTWLPIVGSTAVVVVITLISPMWDIKTTSAFVVTALAIVVAARVAMPSLWRLAEDADANVSFLEEERRVEELMERTTAEAAEDARVVHDTVINTLGAIANSGRGVDQIELVRDRCHGDLAVVEEMLLGRRGYGRLGLAQIGAGAVVSVERSGLSSEDLDELNDLLPPRVVDAMVGAAEEALRNVGKHAGVLSASVEVLRSEGGVRITVTDQGAGFDVDQITKSHGFAESITARVRAVGGEVEVRSQPGVGTVVVISCPLQGGGEPESSDLAVDVEGIVERLARRACWLLAAAVVVVGFVIESVNRPGEPTWTYAMLVLVGVGVTAAYGAVRRWGVLPWPISLALVVALPAGFVASMAGIDFGATRVLTYQAIGIVPLLMILLSMASVRWYGVAMLALVVAAVATAVVLWGRSAEHGAIAIVAVMPALGLGLGWWLFLGLVSRVVEQSEDARRRAFSASVDIAAQREIAQARRRWGTVSLERAAALLRGIAEARLDVADPAVQRACAEEERYLRQLLLLSPRSYRMSVWFAHALAAARSRQIRLTIRSGDADAPDDFSAETVGGVVLEAVGTAPTGADLTVSWFPTSDGPRLSIVRPASHSDAGAETDLSLPKSWRMVRTVFVDQEMVELVVA